MHVIVGQGQLDTVLRATPEERRGFIEEAAGVLKHRKRKERALRKLETMEANLTRVQDLTGEIRRQLGPLGRQAETARRAAVIQADARDARLRPVADDLVQLTSTPRAGGCRRVGPRPAAAEVEEAMADLDHRLAALAGRCGGGPAGPDPRPGGVPLAEPARRAPGRDAVPGQERLRLLSEDDDAGTGAEPGRDPEQLRAQAATCAGRRSSSAPSSRRSRATLEEAVARPHRGRAQPRRGDLTPLACDARRRRPAGGARELGGQVGAKASRIEAREAEIGRLRSTAEQAQARAAEAEREFARLEATVADDEEGEQGLDTAYEQAAAQLEAAEAELARWREAEHAAEQARTAAAARVEALELGLSRKDGAAALLAAADEAHGIIGSVASLSRSSPASRTRSPQRSAQRRRRSRWSPSTRPPRRSRLLRAGDAGRASLIVSESAGRTDPRAWPTLGAGARWARDVVDCPDSLRPALERVLDRVALVESAADAKRLVLAHAGVTAVTRAGDVSPRARARGRSAAPSLSSSRPPWRRPRARVAAADRSGRAERGSRRRREPPGRGRRPGRGLARAAARERRADVRHRRAARCARCRPSRGSRRGRARPSGPSPTPARPSWRTQAAHADLARAARGRDRRGRDRGGAVHRGARPPRRAARQARAAETDLRLGLRTREERARALKDRADALERGARNEEEAAKRLAARRARRQQEARVAGAVRVAADWAHGAPGLRRGGGPARPPPRQGRTERDAQLASSAATSRRCRASCES